MGNGFIRDKLEIKFLILYIASRVSEPLTMAELQGLTMCDGGIDYFAFSECLNELVKTEHLTMTEEDCYAITAKGIRNSNICETSLPYSVRMRADKEIEACNKELLRRAQARSCVIERDNGTYTVELSLSDDMGKLMHLEAMVATRAMADDLAGRFRKNPEKIYTDVISALYANQ